MSIFVYETKKEAKLYKDRLSYQLATGQFIERSFKIFEEVYQKWLPAYEKTVERTTFSRTTDLFRLHILKAFGKKKIVDITPLECQDCLNDWSSRYKNNKQLKSYTSQIFEFAINMNMIHDNPMSRLIMPKTCINRTYNFWTVKELEQFLAIVQQSEPFYHYVMFRLLAYSGMRKGELYALTWNDIDFNENIISITKILAHLNNHPIKKATKKQFSIRKITMDLETMIVLKDWKHQQLKQLSQLECVPLDTENYYCFTYVNQKNQVMPLHADYINNILKKIIQNYRLRKISPHGFRHTHATLLNEIGSDSVNMAN